MKDERLANALKCCDFCDRCSCMRVVKGHIRKTGGDCAVFKKSLRQQNRTYRRKENQRVKQIMRM